MSAPEAAPSAPQAAHDVALEVLRHGPLARSELARRLGLSPGSLSRLSKPLIGSGLLRESAVNDPVTGRPTRPLDVAPGTHHFVGINLTGREVFAVTTDLRADVLERRRIALDDSGPEEVVDVVTRVVGELALGSGPLSGVGVALGGHVVDGVVRHADFLGWTEPVALTSLLDRALDLPVVVGNDLAALTRAEHWFGVARGCSNFAVLTIGAGVGYGLVMHDKVIETVDSSLQLLGHHPLEPAGPRCSQGHRGCASALLTIPAICSAVSASLGRPVDYDEALDLAEAGEPAALAVVADSAHALGRLVAATANFTMVERVLLSGDGLRLAEVGANHLAAGLDADRDARAGTVDVTTTPHDFHRWARGAAGTAIQDFVLAPDTTWLIPTSY